MKKFVLHFFLLISFSVNAQNLPRPKLVVGIVVDQMRYDYLFRFKAHYTDGGLKRLMREGFLFENATTAHMHRKQLPVNAGIWPL